ncbi:MAG: hypothetical protein N3B21_07795 [Clostridia bacterium]|nr:hypothetical protein [Clostridia bacterium]
MEKKYILLAFIFAVILISAFVIYKSGELKRIYGKEVSKGLERVAALQKSILREEDIRHLPQPIQKYLKYVGVIGKPEVQSMKAIVEGEMKMDPKKDWIKVKFEQYNFFDSHPTRLFFMQAKMFGIPVVGLHSYTDDKANMLIKAAGLFTVLDSKGPEMRISDTTTLFNDMCFFVPATLIDKRIEWEEIDSLTVKGTLKTNQCKVSALLYFNEKGELINFISDDRYYTPMDGSCKKARWSTPIQNYKERNGLKLPSYGEAIWHFTEGDYCYARFNDIQLIEYNTFN